MSRNVDRLAQLIWEHLPSDGGDREAGWWRDRCRVVAERLAARGVLAVDSLTDEQAGAVWDGLRASWEGVPCYSPDGMRAALRRCATGEAP